jgi:hypothetical protein
MASEDEVLDRDVVALDHGGEADIVLAGLVRKALGEQLVLRPLREEVFKGPWAHGWS